MILSRKIIFIPGKTNASFSEFSKNLRRWLEGNDDKIEELFL